ncbi:MAG TPA: Gfo/Idh/MocA family oxidoreductase [Planctomycetota bacterium]|nr:Gfo/Idh/MocA family oxidoreductase [Planctomycetota bacterium]
MANPIRWGILGTGRISGNFAEALAICPEGELVAVGSRSEASAAAFAQKHRARRAHGSYEALARDPEVDAIYVGTLHPYHCENTILCLEAGKAVLCEKPFAMHEREARKMVETARRTKRFLMEAMWTHFLPAVVRAFDLVGKGAIGELRMVHADFGFRAPFDPKGRLFDPAQGGGSLLDVGVYPVSLATRLLGEPSRIQSSAVLGKTGVDEQASMLLDYEGGRQAVLSSAVRTETTHTAWLSGSEGRIKIEAPFWKGQRVIVSAGGKEEAMDLPFDGNGFPHQAREVMRCLAQGLVESPRMTHEFSLLVMRTLDRIRAPWSMRYAADSTK